MLQYAKARSVLPFRALSDSTFLGEGTNSTVHKINHRIVFKTPLVYIPDSDGPQHLLEETEDAERALKEEKEWYQDLDKKPHPHRLQSFMAIKEGLFLPKMQASLKDILLGIVQLAVSSDLKRRWAVEIASAAASLEALSLSHCDLKPRNLFIDECNHIKLGDFDAVTRYGEVPSLFPPHWIWYDACTNAQHDLFKIGDTLWELFTGKEYDWGTPKKKNGIPATSGVECGELIDRCWRQSIPSVAALESDLKNHFLQTRYGALAPIMQYFPLAGGSPNTRVLSPLELQHAQRDIERFLVSQAYVN